MAYSQNPAGAGGFLPDSMLSPPQSSVASVSTVTATLPHPRAHPLKPGGTKESTFIRFIDQGILRMERRYAKRGTEMADKKEDESTRGYEGFQEVVKDLENLFELIWVSGTPSLQVPYLLTLASMIEQYLPGFSAAPRPTFRLLERFDIAFASLLQGRHVETGDSLPGFETGRRVTGTEKVRMKSIVERTRGVVAEVMSKGGDEDAESRVEDVTDVETGDEMDVDDTEDEEDEDDIGGIEMSVARVYDRTVVELGDTIGNTPIGIITDE
jgi:hypothetical protein